MPRTLPTHPCTDQSAFLDHLTFSTLRLTATRVLPHCSGSIILQVPVEGPLAISVQLAKPPVKQPSPFPGIYLTDTLTSMQSDVGARSVTSVVVAKYWKLPKCPSVKPREIIAVHRTMEYYTAVKRRRKFSLFWCRNCSKIGGKGEVGVQRWVVCVPLSYLGASMEPWPWPCLFYSPPPHLRRRRKHSVTITLSCLYDFGCSKYFL